MKKMLLKTIACLALLVCSRNDSDAQAAGTLWQTTIRYNGTAGRYEVYARPTQSRSAVSYTLASTITVLLPLGMPHLTATSINATTSDYPRNLSGDFNTPSPWSITASAPNPEGYYVSFDNNNGGRYESDFSLTGGKEYLLFTFTLAGACVPGLRLWQPGDPVVPQCDYATTIPSQGNREQFAGNYNNSGTTCSGESLPVTFGPVTATEKNCNVYLGFSWLNQQNNKQFEIEHSATGANTWKTIAILGNTGNNGNNQYSYVHSSPVAGNNYYRIKQVDTDGRFSYSKTVMTMSRCNGGGNIVSYPNPVHTTLNIVLPANIGKSQIKITDAAGKLISNTTTQQSFNTINTELLPAGGLYLLQVVNGNKVVYTTKFVKE
ncbi:MAG: T9SS type A sorting domain-containing protein [Bacteroidota bacterium]